MMPAIHRILVATDFGPSSTAALDHAATLAARLRACVHVVHVLDESPTATGIHHFHVSDAAAHRERLYAEARARLAKLAAPLGVRGIPNTLEVRIGSPADAISQAVVDYGADLLVVGTHGRTPLQRLLLGSVADRLIRTAGCPVLVARQPHALEPLDEVETVAVTG
jgi:nucleotide-binding universal stress UspA family protein